jgi:hypothetical protein
VAAIGASETGLTTMPLLMLDFKTHSMDKRSESESDLFKFCFVAIEAKADAYCGIWIETCFLETRILSKIKNNPVPYKIHFPAR